MSMLGIVGLGNPGSEHALNRHNIGFMAVDVLAGFFDMDSWKSTPKMASLQGTIEGHKVLLLKPMTYMNRSGTAVCEALQFYKIPLDHVLVIHDELDLEVGRLKLKQGGSSAGHNGLKSMDQHCGLDYWRLRFGIGHPGHKDRVTGYVLGNFAKAEFPVIEERLDHLCRTIPLWLEGKYDKCMQQLSEGLT